MRVIYKRTAVKDMEATRDYIAGRLKNPKAAKKLVTALLKAIYPCWRIILIWARHWQKSLKSPQMCVILWCQSS